LLRFDAVKTTTIGTIITALFVSIAACAAGPELNSKRPPPVIEQDLRCPLSAIRKIANPKYPLSQVQQQGWVVVSYELDGTRQAVNVRIEDSFPAGIFDESVETAVRQTEFKPVVSKQRCFQVYAFEPR